MTETKDMYTSYGRPMPEDYWDINPVTIASINRWVESGIPPGGFLTACLRNEATAVLLADLSNCRQFYPIIKYLNNHVPATAWGSYEKVATWNPQGDDDDDSTA